MYPVDAFHSYEDVEPGQSVHAQALSGDAKEAIFETLGDCDFTEDIIAVPHNKIDTSVSDRSKERNDADESMPSEKGSTESFVASDKDEHLELELRDGEQTAETAYSYTKLSGPPDQVDSLMNVNNSMFCQNRQEGPAAPRRRRGGPISNSIHFMLSAQTLYNYN